MEVVHEATTLLGWAAMDQAGLAARLSLAVEQASDAVATLEVVRERTGLPQDEWEALARATR